MIIKNASRSALAGATMLLAAMFAGCATVEYSSPGKLSGITVKINRHEVRTSCLILDPEPPKK